MSTTDTLGRKNLTTSELVKGQRYDICLSTSGYSNAECISARFGGFRLTDGREVWVTSGQIRGLYLR